MSYLVICTTCDGKMSVNAKKCPHCGETEFFEIKSYFIGIAKCDKCNGSGSIAPQTDFERSTYGWGSSAKMPCSRCNGKKEISISSFDNVDLRQKV